MIYSNNSLSNLFPDKWHGNLSSEEVEELLCLDKKILIQKTHSVLGSSQWNRSKLQNLIKTKGEQWNENWLLPEDDHYLLIWQRDYSFKSSPHAIMSFEAEITEKTKTNKASCICLTNNLMWVDPEYRGKGLGYHLTAHFISYLQACKIYYPFVSRKGIILEFYADFFSKGGEYLSNQIISYLEYMRENKLFWSIKEIIDEVGI